MYKLSDQIGKFTKIQGKYSEVFRYVANDGTILICKCKKGQYALYDFQMNELNIANTIEGIEEHVKRMGN